MSNTIDPNKATELAKKIIVDKLYLVGELVEGSAKHLCRIKSGNLWNSIHYEVDAVDLSVKIGTNVEYAPYIEFGTGELAENGLGRKDGWYFKDDEGIWHFTRGSKPQPFLRPALIENKSKIKALLAL